MKPPYRPRLHRFYRAASRLALRRASTLRTADGAPRDVWLEDVSLTGCSLSGVPPLVPGASVLVGLSGVGARGGRVVWVQDGRAGCLFDLPLSPAEFDLAKQAGIIVRANFGASLPPEEPTATAPAAKRAGWTGAIILGALLCLLAAAYSIGLV